jgi:hypothetical protein
VTHLLVLVCDGLRDRSVIPQGGQPELGDAVGSSLIAPLSLFDLSDLGALLFLVLIVGICGLTRLDLGVGRLGLTGNDGGPALVQGRVF